MNNIKWQAAREAQCLSELAAYVNQTLITNNTNKKETIHTNKKQTWCKVHVQAYENRLCN